MNSRGLRACVKDQRGSFAVEFAMIAPILILVVFGGIGFGLGFWTKNALQDASNETARCLAIGSPLCQTSSCGASSAGICYAIKVAANRGVTNVMASEVTVNPATSYSGRSFTSVTIAHGFSMAGYSFVLTAQGAFPNNS